MSKMLSDDSEMAYLVEHALSRPLSVHLRDLWDALDAGCGKGAMKADFLFFDAYSRTVHHKLRLFLETFD